MAALDLPAEYLEAFSAGVVAAGDLVNLSVDLLPAEWVRVHRVPPDAILVGTIVKVGALGSGDDVDVRVDGVANTIKVPVGHASLSHHVRPAAVDHRPTKFDVPAHVRTPRQRVARRELHARLRARSLAEPRKPRRGQRARGTAPTRRSASSSARRRRRLEAYFLSDRPREPKNSRGHIECNRSTQLALAMIEAFDAPDSKIAGAILLY